MIRALVTLLLVTLLAGCETLSYYRQGFAGQLDFYGARQPIDEVLKRTDLDPEVRRRLELVPQVTAFARQELKLPVKGQYRDYVQLESQYVLWSVFAAPELSLDAYRWCYLFHSLCVEYRGYFSEYEANAYAGKLAARGYDTHVGGVSAFSSLGLLDDPVTSVLTSYPDDVLAMVLFHELAHAVLYVKDDTAFNESFASAVADEGMARWQAAHGETAGSAAVRALQAQQALLTSVALETRAELAALYASPLADDAKRSRKREILAGASANYAARCRDLSPGPSGIICPYTSWFGQDLNNARLNAVATYEHLVPAFASLLRVHGGDMDAFYATTRKLARLPPAVRDKTLRAMMPPGDAAQ